MSLRNNQDSVANALQFQPLLYRPLYWFDNNGRVGLNADLSLAQPPQYAPDGRSVTITLKSYVWSDGQPVTTRDVQFWQNLVTNNKSNWAPYSPGEYPDNVTSVTVNSPTQITLNLSQKYGSYYFTYNQLSQITPLPQHVWDKESATGAIGDYDMTAAGAQAVYKFLDAQSSDVTSYAGNALWQVVDGPWKMKSLDTAGNLKLIPNPMYSGPIKAKLREFDEVAFSTNTSELNALKAGTSGSSAIDFGYLPMPDASQRGQIGAQGYTFQPWSAWGTTFLPDNLTNPTSGPLFLQLYFRQAMQMLIDQSTLISKAYDGNAYPTYGPVPLKPQSDLTDATEQNNPLPYNPSKAVSMLQSHGWTVNPGGITTCSTPGTADTQCGAGIPAGAPAAFKLEYTSAMPTLDTEVTQLKSAFAQAGIQITTSTNTFDKVIGDATPCSPGQACTWDMAFWGGGFLYEPDYYPTGDLLWATGASSNTNAYSDPMMDQLISNTETSDSLQALYSYQDYAAKQLPVLWMPTPYFQLNEVSNHLQGTEPLDPLLSFYPENWYWS
jgi:peptide/nickel transport system substrate-binding protein